MPKPRATPPKRNGAQHGDTTTDIPAAQIPVAQNADSAIPDPRADQPVTDATEPGYCASVAANFLVELVPEPPAAAAGASASKKTGTPGH